MSTTRTKNATQTKRPTTPKSTLRTRTNAHRPHGHPISPGGQAVMILQPSNKKIPTTKINNLIGLPHWTHREWSGLTIKKAMLKTKLLNLKRKQPTNQLTSTSLNKNATKTNHPTISLFIQRTITQALRLHPRLTLPGSQAVKTKPQAPKTYSQQRINT